MPTIPMRLRHPQYRFIEIPRGEKGPRIPGWQSTSCKPHNHFKLQNHLKREGNYGVVLGHGDLIVVDIDDKEFAPQLVKDMPPSFTVTTGSGGVHIYYMCDEIERCIRLQSPGDHIGGVGDIKATGGQVVGPGSLHPNGNNYVVRRNLPIQPIDCDTIKKHLGHLFVAKPKAPKREPSVHNPILDEPQITDMICLGDFEYRGGQYLGEHPVHGSNTGKNLSINTCDNVWYCFRHGTGGGAWHFLAMIEGKLQCEYCGPNSIDRELFLELRDIARDKGYIKGSYNFEGFPDRKV